MYTKEKLYRGKIGKKSKRGWFYSFGAALFLIFMAVILLAAKRPETVKASERFEITSVLNIEEIIRESAEEAAAGSISTIGLHIPLIVIDAGHGGMDSGCLSAGGGVMEKDINLQIAFLVRDRLQKEGFQVLMTRETDEILSKEERVELANSHQADVYVSIHQNTYEGKDKSVGGIETWYDGEDEIGNNKALAECVHREAIKSTGAVERTLIESGELYVLSKTLMPACLIETGFLSNPEECRKLSDAGYQEKLAGGIAEGIITYLKMGKAV